MSIIKVIFPTVLSFIIGMSITPFFAHYFYKYKLWKSVSRQTDNPDAISKAFQKIHNEQEEVRTPRVGGIIIWVSVGLTSLLLFVLARLFPNDISTRLEFVSRNQTWLPFLGFFVGALIGLFEDFLEIFANKKRFIHGLSSRYLVSVVIVIALLSGWWFYSKLGMSSLAIPFTHLRLELGLYFIPVFVLVMLGTFSSRVIDGIDGLAAGVMASAFSAFTVIAFSQNQIDISALCGVITGSILVFLWFNIPPARFYMGETGMLALTVTLALVAFLTDSVLLLPIIGFPLVATSLSSALQIASKKYFGKKIFLIAPLHHHFEALGWSRPKITMRYWVVSIICAFTGVLISMFL